MRPAQGSKGFVLNCFIDHGCVFGVTCNRPTSVSSSILLLFAVMTAHLPCGRNECFSSEETDLEWKQQTMNGNSRIPPKLPASTIIAFDIVILLFVIFHVCVCVTTRVHMRCVGAYDCLDNAHLDGETLQHGLQTRLWLVNSAIAICCLKITSDTLNVRAPRCNDSRVSLQTAITLVLCLAPLCTRLKMGPLMLHLYHCMVMDIVLPDCSPGPAPKLHDRSGSVHLIKYGRCRCAQGL